MQTVSVSEAREQLADLCDTVVSDCDQIVLTRQNGNAVLISMAEWESHRETLRLLRDKAALKALIRSFEDHDAGISGGKSPEEVFTDLT